MRNTKIDFSIFFASGVSLGFEPAVRLTNLKKIDPRFAFA